MFNTFSKFVKHEFNLPCHRCYSSYVRTKCRTECRALLLCTDSDVINSSLYLQSPPASRAVWPNIWVVPVYTSPLYFPFPPVITQQNPLDEHHLWSLHLIQLYLLEQSGWRGLMLRQKLSGQWEGRASRGGKSTRTEEKQAGSCSITRPAFHQHATHTGDGVFF